MANKDDYKKFEEDRTISTNPAMNMSMLSVMDVQLADLDKKIKDEKAKYDARIAELESEKAALETKNKELETTNATLLTANNEMNRVLLDATAKIQTANQSITKQINKAEEEEPQPSTSTATPSE